MARSTSGSGAPLSDPEALHASTDLARCSWTSRRRCSGASRAFRAGIDSSYSGPRARWRRLAGPQDAGPVIAYVFHPKFWPYIEYLGADYLVYHAYDLFERNRGWNKKLDVFQRLLVQRADLAFSSSETTADALESKYGRAPTVIANGADYEAFVAVPQTHSGRNPRISSAIPRPRIGYTGAVSRKMDFELIATLARRRRQWQFVLIGEVRNLDGPLACGAGGGSTRAERPLSPTQAARDGAALRLLDGCEHHVLPVGGRSVGRGDLSTETARVSRSGTAGRQRGRAEHSTVCSTSWRSLRTCSNGNAQSRSRLSSGEPGSTAARRAGCGGE